MDGGELGGGVVNSLFFFWWGNFRGMKYGRGRVTPAKKVDFLTDGIHVSAGGFTRMCRYLHAGSWMKTLR